ncbi:DUF3303 domain-containing protein [Nonlabens ulvanivorans]|uniref:DUF3303 domain-containing protein n=1 Tax=Nonlabens ulvanivorans TaxID=906888 RepID=UPI003D6631DE
MGGTCLCETDNPEALARLMMFWSPLSDCRITPVLGDEAMMAVIKKNPFFESSE